MQGTMTGKILKAHLVEGRLDAGEEVALGIDQTLLQYATGTMACMEFEALGLQEVKVDLAVQYVDHNMLQFDHRNADDHLFLQTFAAKHGIRFSRAGNGICHQVHTERFAPGRHPARRRLAHADLGRVRVDRDRRRWAGGRAGDGRPAVPDACPGRRRCAPGPGR